MRTMGTNGGHTKLIQTKNESESGTDMFEITIRIDEEHAEELIQLGKRIIEAVEKLEEFVEEDDDAN
tara:strand:+ start:207 stop:407 length:201 start_codon:yes stop_codon:yes gene_type:complete